MTSPLITFDPKDVENAYWRKRPLGSRVVTTTDVLDCYLRDHSSLRSGFFVLRLYQEHILHEEIQVTAEHVVAEFSLARDNNGKCLVALARFEASCCLKGVPLDGQLLTADAVASLFPGNREGALGLAHFRAQCCLNKIPIGGVLVTTESVLDGFVKLKAPLELARFKADCCLNNLSVYGQRITPQEVVQSFPDTEHGKRGLARFKEQCCLDGRHLNGQTVTPETVIDELRTNSSALDQARFKADCFFKTIALNGQSVVPEVVHNEYLGASAYLELARFKADCCLKSRSLNGQPVSVRDVLMTFPGNSVGKLGRAHFKAKCCLEGLLLDERPILPESVVRDFKAVGERLGLARFRQSCCLKELTIAGLPVSPESVVRDFQALGALLEIARFKEVCCLTGVKLDGQKVTAENVADSFKTINAQLELARFKANCFNYSLMIKGQTVGALEVVDSFPSCRLGKLGRTRFKADCFIEGLLINGQPVCPVSVIKEFRAIGRKLDLARFKESCCLKNLAVNAKVVSADEVMNSYQALGAHLEASRFRDLCHQHSLALEGQPVSPEAVVNSYQTHGAITELLHFHAWCCLSGQKLHGKRVPPESVVAGFRGGQDEQLSIAQFKSKCCLSGLRLDGQPVSPEEVLDQFPNNQSGKVALAYFKEQCCLRGLRVHGEPVTPESVLQSFGRYQQNKLAIAQFKQECCLRGLRAHGRLIAPRAVVNQFPSTIEGRLGVARFLEWCCLKGLLLDDRPVTPETVAAGFPPNHNGKLGKARFLERCCLNGISLHGASVTTETVLSALQETRCKPSIAAFLAECFLRNRCINGQWLTAKAVHDEYPQNRAGRRQMANFNKRCCLQGLKQYGRLVTPEQVVKVYDEEDWMAEKAVFFAQLTLHAKTLNGNHLTNAEVLAAFDQAPGDNTTRKIEFLTHRLMALPQDSEEAVASFEQAWRIITSAPVKDELHGYQLCILQFLAMRYGLIVYQKPVLPDQVWQSIQTLRESFINTRLRFHFLAYCHINNLHLEGQPVTSEQVLTRLDQLPQCKLRTALASWFAQIHHSPLANILDHLIKSSVGMLSKPVNAGKRPKRLDVYINDPYSPGPFPYQVTEYFDEPSTAPLLLSTHTRIALRVMQSIRPLCITGSFSRCLQGIDQSFNDIDMLATVESLNLLVSRLTGELNSQEIGADIHCHVFAQMLPGCPELKLPAAFSITVTEGDYGHKVALLQASVYGAKALNALERVELPVVGTDTRLSCLSFLGEVGLMADTLRHLISNLDPLTDQLNDGVIFPIPRTVLFNAPQHPQERIFALLMRCLLTLNKARQFCTTLSAGKATGQDSWAIALALLQDLGHRLQQKLHNHQHREPLMTALEQWLSAPHPVSQKQAFVRSLLMLLAKPAELFWQTSVEPLPCSPCEVSS